MTDIVYYFKNNLYIDLTNKCPVKCKYCIKYKWRYKFYGYDLKIKKVPTVEEVINVLKESIKKHPKFKEIVFCGYGEPLIEYEKVVEISKWVKDNYPKAKIRVNTNGLANAYHKKNVLKYLKGFIDKIYISLNAHDQQTYSKLHITNIKTPFNKIINFIKQAKKYIPEVVVTTVEHPEIDIKKVQTIVKRLKVQFKKREFLDEQ